MKEESLALRRDRSLDITGKTSFEDEDVRRTFGLFAFEIRR